MSGVIHCSIDARWFRFAGLPAGFEPSAADITNAIDEYYESEVDIIGMGENDAGHPDPYTKHKKNNRLTTVHTVRA